MGNDKRWSRSQFAGLPSRFVQFAKRLDLQYKSKKKVLVDRDGEPVAWLMDETERRASQLAGLPVLEFVLWHPDGEAKVSYEDLAKIRTRGDLLEFQGRPLKTGEVGALSINDVLEDAKTRAIHRAAIQRVHPTSDAMLKVLTGKLEPGDLPELSDALQELGTIGPGDMLKDVQGQKVFIDLFENVGPIKPEEIAPDAARPLPHQVKVRKRSKN